MVSVTILWLIFPQGIHCVIGYWPAAFVSSQVEYNGRNISNVSHFCSVFHHNLVRTWKMAWCFYNAYFDVYFCCQLFQIPCKHQVLILRVWHKAQKRLNQSISPENCVLYIFVLQVSGHISALLFLSFFTLFLFFQKRHDHHVFFFYQTYF